jgi:hypothetical protein
MGETDARLKTRREQVELASPAMRGHSCSTRILTRGDPMAKGQVKQNKSNKMKLSTKDKQKKKQEKKAAKK